MSKGYWVSAVLLGILTVQAWRVAFSINTDEAGIFAFVFTAIFVAALLIPLLVRHRRKLAERADNALVETLAVGVKATRGLGRASSRFAERVRERADGTKSASASQVQSTTPEATTHNIAPGSGLDRDHPVPKKEVTPAGLSSQKGRGSISNLLASAFLILFFLGFFYWIFWIR